MSRTDLESTENPEVRAAGGVLVRPGADGLEVAVIHRPKYEDWSLPKGKLDGDETFEQAALREVEEETGMRAELGPELSPIHYRDRKGRAKLVRYWLMRVLEGEFRPGSEVDELSWLDPKGAQELLSYEHDAKLVREALAAS
ncbi:MAG TPA: NUDIX hydrolase [Solirubrobacterales bacterium]|jgi:8-oxo-dGTP pyrophosphatase MutT (NUDIX family)